MTDRTPEQVWTELRKLAPQVVFWNGEVALLMTEAAQLLEEHYPTDAEMAEESEKAAVLGREGQRHAF